MYLLVGIPLLLLLLVVLYVLFFDSSKKHKPIPVPPIPDQHFSLLQLQAYERLVVLANRIALPNLISRSNQADFSASQMHLHLIQLTKQEFEHNVSQQIYVSTHAWKAIQLLKNQNDYIINQVANSLPSTATAFDLNQKILEYLSNDERGRLHEIAAEIISTEAKKIF